MSRRQRPKQRRQVRIVFLAQHPELWKHLPEPVNPFYNCTHQHFMKWIYWKETYSKPIVKAMKDAKVLAPSVTWHDVNTPGLIIEAKKLLDRESSREI